MGSEFEVDGAHKVVGGVKSDSVVECIDIVLDHGVCHGKRCQGFGDTEFGLCAGEKALGRGVIPAISLATHTWDSAKRRESILVRLAGVGAATARVMHERGMFAQDGGYALRCGGRPRRAGCRWWCLWTSPQRVGNGGRSGRQGKASLRRPRCDRRDVTHATCGLTTVKLRSSRFGAIGSTCLESVVAFCVFARKDLRYA